MKNLKDYMNELVSLKRFDDNEITKKSIYSYIYETADTLTELLDSTLRKNKDQLTISYDPEDDLYLDMANRYGLSELIMKRDDSLKKMFHTKNIVIELVSIQIVPKLRSKGLGKIVLAEIAAWADEHNYVITLDPDDMFNTPLSVLYNLYGKYGFESSENFETTPNCYGKVHRMVRFPNKVK